MENNEETKQEEVVNEAIKEVSQPEGEAKATQPVDNRPEINYKAEIERRKANEDKLRYELEQERSKQVKRYDANDITTWNDTELVALKNSQDPNHLQYRQKAEDELFDRKMERAMERQRQQDKRSNAERELLSRYPEVHNPEFAAAMDQVMFDLDLQKSPAGRLAAAEIVALRSSKGSSKANAAGRKQEEARLKDVKQTLSEGDRPDPRQTITNPKQHENLMKIVNDPKTSKEDKGAAMGRMLKDQGLDFNKFFGR